MPIYGVINLAIIHAQDSTDNLSVVVSLTDRRKQRNHADSPQILPHLKGA